MSQQATRKVHDYDNYDALANAGEAAEEEITKAESQTGRFARGEDDGELIILGPRQAEGAAPENSDGIAKFLGQRLREGREALDLSVKEVATRLYLEPKIIEALEADDYEQLPAPIFVQGYIRGYAKMLDLPAESLLKLYYQQNPSKHPKLTSAAAPGHAVQAGSSRDTWYKALTFLIIVALIVLVALWRHSSEQAQPPELPLAPLLPPVEPGNSLPDNSPQTPAVTEIPLNLQPDAENISEFTPPGEEEGASDAEPITVPTQEEIAQTAPAQPAGDPNSLKLSFNAESWVEISDGTGAKLYSRTARAGENLALTGTPPFKFVLGRSDAVKLEYQDKTVDLSSYRGRVARFNLSPEGIQ
jgi:cytoskeleton protein RodZ